jgi:hypothetical protein
MARRQVLRGAKPGDLPVQFPTKFEMILNRKTATALGLAIPPRGVATAPIDNAARHRGDRLARGGTLWRSVAAAERAVARSRV